MPTIIICKLWWKVPKYAFPVLPRTYVYFTLILTFHAAFLLYFTG